jgi:hypothetical protein
MTQMLGMYECVHIYIYIYIYSVDDHIYIHVCMCVCVCVCMFVCGHLKKNFVFMKRVGRDCSQYGNRMIGKISEEKDIIPVHEMLCGFKTRN